MSFIRNDRLAPYTMQALVDEYGVGDELDMRVNDRGVISLSGKKYGAVASETDLYEFASHAGLGHVGQADLLDTTRRLVKIHHENHTNDRIFQGRRLSAANIAAEFRHGNAFDLPLVRLPPERAEVFSTRIGFDGLQEIQDFFVQPDGSVLVPIHPEQMEHFDFAQPDENLPNARNSSSERTIHVTLPSGLHCLVKLPLPDINLAEVVRPIPVYSGTRAVKMTEYLGSWSFSHQIENDPFCILPEVMSLGDTETDQAVVIRTLEAFPPAENKSYYVPMYSLTAEDSNLKSKQPPMLVRMINNRPDKSVSPLDYFEEKFLKPMIGAALRVRLDLGSAAQDHMQNTQLEIGEDGQPSGRIAYQDLEAFWPNPALADPLGREDFFRANEVSFKESYESDVHGTFRTYFANETLLKVCRCFAKAFKEPWYKRLGGTKTHPVTARARKVYTDEIQRRKDAGYSFEHPVLAPFAKYPLF